MVEGKAESGVQINSTFLNVMVTVIAILLGLQLVLQLGFHASPIPVVIKGPFTAGVGAAAEGVPVIIKGPLATTGSICANPCK